MTMTRVGLMQEFPAVENCAGAERARDAERSDVATEVAALATRREVAVAWLARHYAERQSRAIAAQIDEARLQQSTTAALYGVGRASQAEVLAARTTTVELANRATDAALAGERARLALARHVGAGDAERPLPAPPDVLALPDAIGQLTDVARQPELRLAHAQEALLDTEADLARAGRLPDWSAELTYGIRKAEFANMVSLMVRVDLPWSPGTRQDREHAAKLKERDAARAQREDLSRLRDAEVRQMLAEWDAMRAQAARTPARSARRAPGRGRWPRTGAGPGRSRRCWRRGARSWTRTSRRSVSSSRPRGPGRGSRRCFPGRAHESESSTRRGDALGRARADRCGTRRRRRLSARQRVRTRRERCGDKSDSGRRHLRRPAGACCTGTIR
jgi:hypothetical protein